MLAVVVVLVLACPSLSAAAADPEILVVGDSWARQIYDDGAFADGFESGDTTAWSLTTP